VTSVTNKCFWDTSAKSASKQNNPCTCTYGTLGKWNCLSTAAESSKEGGGGDGGKGNFCETNNFYIA
jgi:hypothetical protein